MRKIGAEIISGIAILLAMIIFVVGFIYLKNVTFTRDRYNVYIEFNDVTGLEPSDVVSVAGLRIGKVTDMKLSNLNVTVEVEIDSDIRLPGDSQARIKSMGMVGEKFVDIVPGTANEYLEDGDVISGMNAGDFSDITGSMDGLIEQAEELMINIRATFDNVFDLQTQRALKESLMHLRNISSTLDDNTGHMERTLVHMDTISSGISQILDSRRDKIGETIDNVHLATTKLDEFTARLDTTLTTMQTLLTKVENQEGAVGKLIYNDEFYDEMRHLTTELDGLVQDLKKHPQKYLNLGFIKVF